MKIREEDIVYDQGDYWVLKLRDKKKGYEVYRSGLTHSTRCAQIGWEGPEGLQRAIKECERRHAKS